MDFSFIFSKSVESAGKDVNNGKDVFDDFSFWRQIVLVENHDFCAIELTEPFNEFKAKSGKSVFVGNNNRADMACTDGFQNGSKSFPFEVKSTGNVGNEFG